MGHLIVLSGLDGSGKTTQAQRIYEACSRKGVSAASLHLKTVKSNKYFPNIKNKLQRIVIQNNITDKNEIHNIGSALLFCEKVQDIVIPSLQTFDFLILDRYLESAMCAHHLIDGLYPSVQQIYSKLVAPNINIFLDLSPNECYLRIKNRGNSTSFETPEYLKKAYLFYHSIKDKFLWIDATKPEDVIAEQLISLLDILS